MAMRRWDPWSDFARIQDELSRTFERTFGRPGLRLTQWMPPADVYEKEDKFIVTLELPDIDPKDVDIAVVGNTLRVKGERKHTQEVKEENYYTMERFYGSFERSFDLPVAVKAEEVEAKYKDGLLTIELPKAEMKKAKEIQVKVED